MLLKMQSSFFITLILPLSIKRAPAQRVNKYLKRLYVAR